MGAGPVPLDGSASSDADGDVLAYDWVLSSAPPGSRAQLSGAEGPQNSFVPDRFGRYVVSLVVSDDEDHSQTAYGVIDVESAQFASSVVDVIWEPIRPGGSQEFRNAIFVDANEDGVNDMVLGSCEHRMSVFLRTADSWALSSTIRTDPASRCHAVYGVGDFNRDGHEDLAVGNEVFLGDGQGAFSLWVDLDEYDSPSGLATGDFNGDGIDDMAISGVSVDEMATGSDEDSSVRIVFGGTTLPLRRSATILDPLGLGVVPFEFSGDGLTDFAYYSAKFDSNGESDLAVVLANSSENYTPVISRLPGFGRIGAGDLNGDGFADLILSVFGGTIQGDLAGRTQRFETDARVATLLGNGDGTFQTARYVGAPGAGPGGVHVFDANRDGMQDVLLLDLAPVRISVLLGDGSGGYSALANFADLESGIPTVGDADGDGRIDVAIPIGARDGIWMLWGRDLPF